jgi:exopolysaccharide biosynthesis polyprenyl glycosylphosphotransferase
VPEPTQKPVLRAVAGLTDAPARDVRASRPYLLTGRLIASGLRRAIGLIALFAIDLAGIAMAVYGALVLKELYLSNSAIQWGILWQAEVQWLPFLALVTVLVFWRAGLYGPRETRSGFASILSSLAVVAIVTFGFGLATDQDITTGSSFVASYVLASFFVGLLRWSYESMTSEVLRAVGAQRVALLVGSGARVDSLRGAVERNSPDIRYLFVEVADELELMEAIAAQAPDEILVDGHRLEEEDLVELLAIAHKHGLKVRVAPSTAEFLTHQAAYVPGRAVPLFELRPPVLSGADWLLKRTFDFAVSALVIIAGLPIWACIAAAIKLTSRGSVFYSDPRIGVGERQFRMLKFRTMYEDAEARQGELEELNEADGALFKLRRDPRVTPVGRILRRLSLDEMPNVLNVVRGEMSLVGPRPLPIRDYTKLEPWHRKRYLVLPGITGLWQISGRSNLSFDDLVRLDFYYLERWSIWLDISILIKTIPAVLARRGAY